VVSVARVAQSLPHLRKLRLIGVGILRVGDRVIQLKNDMTERYLMEI
jgi:hypothetical protein